MTLDDTHEKHKQDIADDLVPYMTGGKELSRKLGLDPYPVKYWVVDHEEMNRLMAYGGFQERYPHWRWGMQYHQQKMKDMYTAAHAFEIVINDNPAHAYLQESNQTSDHKTVITHVEAHSDFFKNNKAFKDLANDIDATKQLARHQERIEDIISEEGVSREEVEEFIDNILCIEDNINQHETDFQKPEEFIVEVEDSEANMREKLKESGFSEGMVDEIIEEADMEEDNSEDLEQYDDLMMVLMKNGMYYDEEQEKAVEMKDWQKDIIQMLRTEAYYTAPQKMTQLMNEGWASFWQSLMMTDEEFATSDEIIRHSDLFSSVLGGQGFNPYRIGCNLWEYVEKSKNREHLSEQLLKVEGITPDNFHDHLNEEDILTELIPPEELSNASEFTPEEIENALPSHYIDEENLQKAKDGDLEWKDSTWKLFTYDALAHRNYTLLKPQNKSYIYGIYQEEVDQIYRYVPVDERDKYESITEALDDINYGYGWDKMREFREIYTDPNFIDRFLTEEFVEEYNYFAYEPNYKEGQMQVSSTDYEDIKKKLLLRFTNFGKPRVKAIDTNYENEGRLLLEHQYNGINLDLAQARDVVKRLQTLWGRPVHLRTIQKKVTDDGFEEEGLEVYYEDKEVGQRKLDKEQYEHLLQRTSYDTTPDDWF